MDYSKNRRGKPLLLIIDDPIGPGQNHRSLAWHRRLQKWYRRLRTGVRFGVWKGPYHENDLLSRILGGDDE